MVLHRLFLAAAILAILPACSPDNRAADIRACIANAQRGYLKAPGESAEVVHDQIGGMVAECMSERGYSHDERAMSAAKCVDDVDYNPACYLRRS